ncbi:hypothetical protein ES703_15135 [subsurface metagenome]
MEFGLVGELQRIAMVGRGGMKKSLLVILAAVVVLATVFTLLPASPSPVSAQVNLILNPGFEEPDGCAGMPDNWTPTGTSLGRSTDAYLGNCSANITGASSYYTQIVRIEPNVRYRLSGCTKATESTAYLKLTLKDSGGGVVYTGYLSWNQTVWSEELGNFGTPSTAFYAVIKLEITPEEGASNPEAWFDDILLEEKAGCFIATAAYGTPLAEEIDVLRQFRDQYLLTNPAGQLLVSLYYKSSPPLANLISKHEGLRAVIRMALEPITWLCSRITAPPSP